MGYTFVLRVSLSCVAVILFVMAYRVMAPAPLPPDEHGSYLNLKSQVFPAGTQVAFLPNHGARVMYIHRNYMVMSGKEAGSNGAGTPGSVWDISDLQNPRLIREFPGWNGHMWWQYATDDRMILYRTYALSELTGNGLGEYNWIDLSALPNLQPYTGTTNIETDSDARFRISTGGLPYTYRRSGSGGEFVDIRSGQVVGRFNLTDNASGGNLFLLGNLLFMTPTENHNAFSVWDISDPAQPRLLDEIAGYLQYSNAIHIWRHYIIALAGGDHNPDENGNPNAANMVVIDFSDPTDLRVAWTEPMANVRGRYMTFQDQYAYSGSAADFRQYDMVNRRVAQRFNLPSPCRGDFMVPPIGSNLIISGAQEGGSNTYIISTSDEADNTPPYAGYHLPQNGATNQSLTTSIGFVINETLIGETVRPENIRVRPVGGEPIRGDVLHTQFQTVQWAPRQPLSPNTTYEVTLIEGGIRDVSGNGIEEYTFYFSTGATIEDGRNEPPVISEIDTNPLSPIDLGNAVAFTATVNDPNDDSMEFQLDFGDGTVTSWSSTLEASHTYAAPGSYTVSLRARDNVNTPVMFRSSIVVSPSLTQSPVKSGEMALSPSADQLWTVNPDNNSVAVIDLSSWQRIDEIAVSENPTSIAFDNEGNAWVTCQDANEIVIISPLRTVTQRLSLPYGSAPVSILFDHDHTTAFVAEYGAGTVRKISALSRNTVTRRYIGPTPKALALNGPGTTLAVSRFVSPDRGGEIWQLSSDDLTIERTLSITPDGSLEDTPTQSRGIANYIAGLSFSPTREELWYAAKKDNIFRGEFIDGQPLTFESTVRNQGGSFNISTGAENVSSRVHIDNQSQMADIAFGPFGNELFMAMQSNNVVVAFNPVTRIIMDTLNVGLAPQSLLIDEERSLLYVKNFMDRSVSVIDIAGMVNAGVNDMHLVRNVSTVTNELLSPEVLLGKKIFYNAQDPRMSADGYISCASCHLNGADDGRTWDFTDRGEGMRNTTSLHGRAGLRQGRVHWSANFDEIQDFENDIREAFSGAGFMSDADFTSGTTSDPLGDTKAGRSVELDALAAYVVSLTDVPQSPHRNEDGTMTAAALQGQALFNELNCGSCHIGADFTDSPTGQRHDVGTITDRSGQRRSQALLGIDAPTLVGAWATAPYLHDGSAATIRDVLTTSNSGGAHADITDLSSEEIDNLVAFVLQLDGSSYEVIDSDGFEVALSLSEDPAAGAEMTLGVNLNNINVQRVLYYANGEQVASSDTPPFQANWQVPASTEGLVEFVVKAIHDNGVTGTVSPEMQIQFGIPVASVNITPAVATLNVGETLQLNAEVAPLDASDPSIVWSASNSGVLVTSGGLITASLPGTTTIRARASNGRVGTAVITVTVPVNSIVINPSSPLNLQLGATRQLTATVLPSNAADPSYTWVSDNPGVVAITSDGMVTATGPGTTLVRAVHSPSVSATIRINVSVPVEGVEIDQGDFITIFQEETRQLTATISPANATNMAVTWSSDNPAAVTVEASTGFLQAHTTGSSIVTVTTQDGSFTDNVFVSVTASAVVPVTDITVTPLEVELITGEEIQLTAAVLPVNATDPSYTWLSLDETIASVSDDGVVTAHRVGTTEIRAVHSADVYTSVQVTVLGGGVAVTGIQLSEAEVMLAEGERHSFTYTITPSDASDQSVSWRSSDPSVAVVNTSGVITALVEGTTTITVTTNDGSYSAEATVHVVPVEHAISSILFSPDEIAIQISEPVQLVPLITPDDASSTTLLWQSQNPTVATVNENGLVTGVNAGGTLITVSTPDGSHSASIHVIVSAPGTPQSDIPKFFSPNGDTFNATWQWNNLQQYATCEVSVFARNGHEVYRSKPYNNDWNGTVRGEEVNAGDYYYIIKCDDGNSVKGALRVIK